VVNRIEEKTLKKVLRYICEEHIIRGNFINMFIFLTYNESNMSYRDLARVLFAPVPKHDKIYHNSCSYLSFQKLCNTVDNIISEIVAAYNNEIEDESLYINKKDLTTFLLYNKNEEIIKNRFNSHTTYIISGDINIDIKHLYQGGKTDE